MRHKSKTCSLEAKFPLLAIEQGCLISKDADITVAFRVELPELFTVTSAEYEAMHSAWHKAIKVLPDFSIVHKQDWFISEEYQGKLSEGELSFLAPVVAAAQGNGMAGINEATKMVTSYFDPGTKLIYAIGAVVGLIGGIKVYNKFSSGDPDTSKTAASWFGACIFLIVAATILRSFFL